MTGHTARKAERYQTEQYGNEWHVVDTMATDAWEEGIDGFYGSVMAFGTAMGKQLAEQAAKRLNNDGGRA